ncbi:NAD(P)H-binding protein [Acidisoma cellulosilytica]|uniref:NAD(P)H-binding protein n=1 Tax=Acidisoma cellulosilyticum TaxID=2802395 RepID=A0A963Z0H8_9PROT|nr:NAD(P)H-binding protein [Acidisoma cellulosilyticum]MCB8880284.1 NAD(P)H-binding protein [Acidisoma cellulosilyticum]
MSDNQSRIALTGASGQLGRLVVAELLKTVAADRIVALVRSEAAGASFASQGVDWRIADYDRPDTLAAALAGIDRLLLISSNDLAHRIGQHAAVIAAAKAAGVSFIAYTSVLHADVSPLGLAADHRATELALRESGLAYALLRNGWYTENYFGAIAPALAHGVVLGSSGEGRISAAPRADYAAAAAVVLTSDSLPASQVFELAGDNAFTLPEFAAALSRASGDKPVKYMDMPQAEYKAALLGVGLPEPIAELVSDSSAAAADDVLFDDGQALSGLIGRKTTPLDESLSAALAAA